MLQKILSYLETLIKGKPFFLPGLYQRHSYPRASSRMAAARWGYSWGLSALMSWISSLTFWRTVWPSCGKGDGTGTKPWYWMASLISCSQCCFQQIYYDIGRFLASHKTTLARDSPFVNLATCTKDVFFLIWGQQRRIDWHERAAICPAQGQ